MNIFNTIFKNKGSRVWFIVSFSVIVFFLVVVILAETVFFDLLIPVLGKRMEKSFGGGTYYVSDYEDKEDAFTKSNLINEQINDEGIVMLKNEGNALPLSNGAKISVFGKNSINLAYGGSGSGAFTVTEDTPTIYASLQDAGFRYNETLKRFYENNSQSGEGRLGNPKMDNAAGVMTGFGTGETPQSSYTESVKTSYNDYSDAALVVFSRIGGESFDLPRSMKGVDGELSEEDHYLELDKNEQDLLVEVCSKFDKVIIIINSATPLELGFLDERNDNDGTLVDGMADIHSKIDGALWIGCPGYSGIMSLGRVLNGKVNPSGRTIDTYQRDFTKDPTYENFAANMVDKGNLYLTEDGSTPSVTEHYLDYEEGIYLGYRYYETRSFTENQKENATQDEWYNNQVVYPFGYGLSYTTFSWEITETSPADGSELSFGAANNACPISISVRVTNTGSVDGKEVVQIYCTTPYLDGQIEKAHVVLCGFAKTSLLKPGRSEVVTIELDAYDFASYDYSDANNNDFKGYELDAGTYILRAMKNSHTEVDSVSFTVGGSGVQYANDPVTGTQVVNYYDDVSHNVYGCESYLSRTDWTGTYPVNEVANGSDVERTVSAEFMAKIKSTATNNPIIYQTDLQMPVQSVAAYPAGEMQLYDLIAFNEDDEVLRDSVGMLYVAYNDPGWDDYLNILTVNQMMDYTMKGAFQTIALESIGMLPTFSSDGPVGFVYFMSANPNTNPVYETCSYASECVIAATWNVELARAMGESVGNEGVIGNERGDGRPYSGWYAPAINLHRTPFSGRNFEYYSEDPFISGRLAANVVIGARSKGVYCQVKHFAVNDQETNRSGVCTWLTEQSLREIYLKPFEMAVKEGGALGIMSSFNRIGSLWTGGDYNLLTNILRNEWGFQGLVITDFNTEPFMDTKQMAYAGGDLNLATLASPWQPETAADVIVLRNSVKNILYATVRSNAMNGCGEGGYYITYYAWWELTLIFLEVGLVLGAAVWGFFAIKGAIKQKKEESVTDEDID